MKKKYATPTYMLHHLRSQTLLAGSGPYENSYYDDQADIKFSSDMVDAEEAE